MVVALTTVKSWVDQLSVLALSSRFDGQRGRPDELPT